MTESREKTPGYPEETPDSTREAQQPGAKKPCNPDEGGLSRDPEPDTSTR